MASLAASVSKFFLGEDRKLRHIWRAAIYFALSYWVVFPLLGLTFPFLARMLGIGQGLSAGAIALGETYNFAGALVVTGLLALYERRRPDSYGLPISQALGKKTWEGLVAGFVLAAAVGTGIYLLGGMQIHGLALTGSALAFSALAWLGANICVGVAEEFWFRSYFLHSLWRAIGFWPAAIVIALIFTAAHYFFKTGENIWDVITLMSFSLLMCYTVLKTGTLWFAVGIHIAFDYMQLFVIGTPNGNMIPEGRLLDVTFSGPAWLTGGVLGTEASFLMYPAMALLWFYVWWRYRPPAATAKEPPGPKIRASQGLGGAPSAF